MQCFNSRAELRRSVWRSTIRRLLGRELAHSGTLSELFPSYWPIWMGSLAWRVTYQHGRVPPSGRSEWLQGTSSSG